MRILVLTIVAKFYGYVLTEPPVGNECRESDSLHRYLFCSKGKHIFYLEHEHRSLFLTPRICVHIARAETIGGLRESVRGLLLGHAGNANNIYVIN